MTIATNVAIIGAGPAGALLSHALDRAGISSVVVERASRAHVLGRIRAGVLEWGTVEFLRELGVSERMDAEGHAHDGTGLVWGGREVLMIDMHKYAGSQIMSYGQTMLQEDLYLAADRRGGQIVFEAGDVELHDVTSARPSVTFVVDGEGPSPTQPRALSNPPTPPPPSSPLQPSPTHQLSRDTLLGPASGP